MFTNMPTQQFTQWAQANRAMRNALQAEGFTEAKGSTRHFHQGPHYFHLWQSGNTDTVIVWNRQTGFFTEFNQSTPDGVQALRAALAT